MPPSMSRLAWGLTRDTVVFVTLCRLELEIQRLGAPRIGVDKDIAGLVTPCELENP